MKKCGQGAAALVSSDRKNQPQNHTRHADKPQEVQFTIEAVPVKERARLGKNRNLYSTSRTKADEDRIGWAAKAAMGTRPPFTGPIELEILAYLPVPHSWGKARRAAALTGRIRPTRTPDWDNIGKSISDALNKIVFHDDRQVVTAHVWKYYGESACTLVTVKPLKGASDE